MGAAERRTWVVVLQATDVGVHVFGPMEDKDTAEEFARWVTANIDPAYATQMRSPVGEMLGEWDYRTSPPTP